MGVFFVEVENTPLVDQFQAFTQIISEGPGLLPVQPANTDEAPAENISFGRLDHDLGAHAAERPVRGLFELFDHVLCRHLEVFVGVCQDFDTVAPLLSGEGGVAFVVWIWLGGQKDLKMLLAASTQGPCLHRFR